MTTTDMQEYVLLLLAILCTGAVCYLVLAEAREYWRGQKDVRNGR